MPCFDVGQRVAEGLTIVSVWLGIGDHVDFVFLVQLSTKVHQVWVANVECLFRLGRVVVELVANACHLLAWRNTSLCH